MAVEVRLDSRASWELGDDGKTGSFGIPPKAADRSGIDGAGRDCRSISVPGRGAV